MAGSTRLEMRPKNQFDPSRKIAVYLAGIIPFGEVKHALLDGSDLRYQFFFSAETA